MTKDELKLEIKRQWEEYKGQDEELANLMANDASDNEIQDHLIDMWHDFDNLISPEDL